MVQRRGKQSEDGRDEDGKGDRAAQAGMATDGTAAVRGASPVRGAIAPTRALAIVPSIPPPASPSRRCGAPGAKSGYEVLRRDGTSAGLYPDAVRGKDALDRLLDGLSLVRRRDGKKIAYFDGPRHKDQIAVAKEREEELEPLPEELAEDPTDETHNSRLVSKPEESDEDDEDADVVEQDCANDTEATETADEDDLSRFHDDEDDDEASDEIHGNRRARGVRDVRYDGGSSHLHVAPLEEWLDVFSHSEMNDAEAVDG